MWRWPRYDDVGDPLTLLKGTDKEKPFLSQFRKRADLCATKMFEHGVVYYGAQPASGGDVSAARQTTTATIDLDVESDEEVPPAPPPRPDEG
eukprot:COSAG06_NODE_28138_length_580_cov_0.704782_1_plen_91_part_10